MNKRQSEPHKGDRGAGRPPRPTKRHKSGDNARFKLDLIDGWSLVFLRSGRHFYYKKSENLSAWEAPEEVVDYVYDHVDQNLILVLVARARGLKKKDDVYWKYGEDTLSSRYPMDRKRAVAEVKADSSVAPDEADADAASAAAPAAPADESDEYSSDDESEGEDNGIDFAALMEEDSGEEDAAMDAAPAAESGLPEAAVALFKELLSSFSVNPFGTWDNELQKVVNDDRYQALETRADRETVFTQWCKEQIKQRRVEQASEAQEAENDAVETSPAEEFVLLLKDTFKKGKFYVEYRRKHKSDVRFAENELSDKEKEAVYRAYSKVAKTTKKEKRTAFESLLHENVKLLSPSTDLASLPATISNDIKSLVLDQEDRAKILEEHVGKLTRGEIASASENKLRRQKQLLLEKEKAAEAERRKTNWATNKGKKRLDRQNEDLDRQVSQLGMAGLKSQLEG